MFFKGIKIDGYRGLRKFSVENLGSLNLIGGLNGTGKTTFLEALFNVIDFRDPVVTMKPSLWRQLPTSVASNSNILFNHASKKKAAHLAASTRLGLIDISYRYEPQPPGPSTPIKIQSDANLTQTSDREGLTSIIRIDGNIEGEYHNIDNGSDGFEYIVNAQGRRLTPRAVILSRKTIDNPNDIANRFSQIVEMEAKGDVLEAVQVVIPQIKDLQLLTFGNATILNASLDGRKFIPASYLGDGAVATLSAVMSIISCPDGVLLLDEFDAAIHYSRMSTVWTALAKIGKAKNCQIFAATHSRETINAALLGSREAQTLSGLRYMRFDRIDDDVVCTQYNHKEVSSALAEEWEIR